LTTVGTDQVSRDSFSREREHLHWSAHHELLSAGTSHHLPSGTNPISHDISRFPRSQDLPTSSTPYWPRIGSHQRVLTRHRHLRPSMA